MSPVAGACAMDEEQRSTPLSSDLACRTATNRVARRACFIAASLHVLSLAWGDKSCSVRPAALDDDEQSIVGNRCAARLRDKHNSALRRHALPAELAPGRVRLAEP
jgi:hypothetical protein